MNIQHARKNPLNFGRLSWPKSILCALILYVLLSRPVAAPLYNLILFPPNQSRAYPAHWLSDVRSTFGAHVQEERVANAQAGSNLAVWYFEKPGSKRVFLFSHGRGIRRSNRLNIIRAMLANGYSVIDYDYTGTGASTGSASTNAVCSDVETIYDYLVHNKHYTARDIIAYGQSFGCGPTGYVASIKPVTAVILQSGYSSLRDGAQYTLPWLRVYPDWMFGEDVFYNVKIFRAHHPPLLVLAGNHDWILPSEQTQRIYDQACEPKAIHLVDGGAHNLASSQYSEVCAVVQRFINEVIQ